MKTSCKTLELLRQAMVNNNSLVCCGLDPDISKIPVELREGFTEECAVKNFLRTVIDLTAPYVCAYKAQKAFFDIYPNGYHLLREIIEYVHTKYAHLPIFVDSKIGDVEHTMATYLRNIFNQLKADGVVVNPYLGDDVMGALKNFPDKAAIVTVRTSNPGAAVVQDILLPDGKPLWHYILELVVNRWNSAGNMVPVIASTTNINLQDIRQAIPNGMPILFAGYGEQGGSAALVRHLVDSTGRGVFVNSSRGLLYPYDIHDVRWRECIVQATVLMKDALNFEKSRSKFLLILGVSGVGKSTVIKELQKLDRRIVYISPLMTRVLRPGEEEKMSISNEELDTMKRNGRLLAVNELYGVRYATPREPVEQAFRDEKIPVLDWPIEHLSVMQEALPGRIFTVYMEPPNLDVLRLRLADGRDPNKKRLNAAAAELATLAAGSYDSLIDYRTVNQDGEASIVAQTIYQTYLQAVNF